MEKVSVFIKIRVLFWPEISAYGVFFNFDNERMRPLNTQVPPPPPPPRDYGLDPCALDSLFGCTDHYYTVIFYSPCGRTILDTRVSFKTWIKYSSYGFLVEVVGPCTLPKTWMIKRLSLIFKSWVLTFCQKKRDTARYVRRGCHINSKYYSNRLIDWFYLGIKMYMYNTLLKFGISFFRQIHAILWLIRD